MRPLLYCLAVVALLYALLPLLRPWAFTTQDSFACIDWKLEQQKRIPSPRILIIGGSNASHSINSERISKHFNLPVYNLGVCGWLGMPNWLHHLELITRPGDIVIATFEYQFATSSPKDIALLSLENPNYVEPEPMNLQEWLVFEHARAYQVFEASLYTLFTGKNQYRDSYTPEYYNQYGDITYHLRKENIFRYKPTHIDFTPVKVVDKQAMEYLAESKKRGVTNLYFPPGISEGFYKHDSTEILTYVQGLRHQGWPVVCQPRELLFPDTAFYDTDYHLRNWGRERRTDFMIARLDKVLAPVLRAKQKWPVVGLVN